MIEENDIVYYSREDKANIARWKEKGVGSTAEVMAVVKESTHEDIVEACNKETRKQVKLKCKELLDTIQLPERQKAKERKLKRELIDMLVYERLIFTEDGDELGPTKSPIDVVEKSGLPKKFVDSIVDNAGWDYWNIQKPITNK